MKISGNQTAIAEILYSLDKEFVPPFVCKCNGANTHKLNCEYQSKDFEKEYGCSNYVYYVDYDGEHIKSIKLLHRGYSNGNLKDGCVK